jgi:hypothetical protein
MVKVTTNPRRGEDIMSKTLSTCIRLVAALGLTGLSACGMFTPSAYTPRPGGAGLPPAAPAGAANATPGAQGDDAALAGFEGTCLKVAKCYVRLAKDFCAGASDCQFKVSIEGNDQDACRRALVRVPQVVKPLQMVKPGYSLPAECTQ